MTLRPAGFLRKQVVQTRKTILTRNTATQEEAVRTDSAQAILVRVLNTTRAAGRRV